MVLNPPTTTTIGPQLQLLIIDIGLWNMFGNDMYFIKHALHKA
jgi:hypothetical protein